MSNTPQYVIHLLIIVAILFVDNYLIIETQSDQAPADMVWIDGDAVAASAAAEFTDHDATQDSQLAGFWIDSTAVSKAEYQAFLAASGYVGTAHVAPRMPFAEPSLHKAPAVDTIFALRDRAAPGPDDQDVQFVSKADALAYCHWKGLDLSSTKQARYAAHHTRSDASAAIALHASQPLSDLSGFRCIKFAN